ncbi:hypothetical protein PIB30_096785, partial [Stylosanthes scabra]|nr:hypothetical protein [Stylosanthes scabra]
GNTSGTGGTSSGESKQGRKRKRIKSVEARRWWAKLRGGGTKVDSVMVDGFKVCRVVREEEDGSVGLNEEDGGSYGGVEGWVVVLWCGFEGGC